MFRLLDRGGDRESIIVKPRGRLLRSCVLIGLAATALGGLPRWDPNPDSDVQLVQHGIPLGWIRTCDPHGLEIRVGGVQVPGPRLRDDDPVDPAREFTFPVVLEPVRLVVDVVFWSVVAMAALTRPRRLSLSLLVGLGITAALAAIPYEFCSDGNAHGLPFAIVHPHGSDMPVLGIPLPVPGEQTWVFDLLNLARNWLFWSVVAFGGATLWPRWRARTRIGRLAGRAGAAN